MICQREYRGFCGRKQGDQRTGGKEGEPKHEYRTSAYDKQAIPKEFFQMEGITAAVIIADYGCTAVGKAEIHRGIDKLRIEDDSHSGNTVFA